MMNDRLFLQFKWFQNNFLETLTQISEDGIFAFYAFYESFYWTDIHLRLLKSV